MKNPLRYQISEYDCGPTSLLNAISFLFAREDIPPELIRNIMLYTLDTYTSEGRSGRFGTSRTAMRFISGWLSSYGETGLFPVTSSYLEGDAVYIGAQSPVNAALRRGGVAVVRLYLDVEHYILMTGDTGKEILLFDPYLYEIPENMPFTGDEKHPAGYNRIVPYDCFNHIEENPYSLGRKAGREAVLLFNTATMRKEEEEIEYFI